MKKTLLIAALLYSAILSALPVGNPSEASLFFNNGCRREWGRSRFDHVNFIVGYYGDFVFNRHLKTKDRHIDYSRITTNAGYLALTGWEIVELFTTWGATKLSLNTSLVSFNVTNRPPRFELETTTTFSWSIGGRATLWEYECLSLGIMGQYFTSKPGTKVWFLRANISGNPDEQRRRYTEWQFGAGISYRYSYYFVPYIAIKWARAFWGFNNQNLIAQEGIVATLVDLKNSKDLGGAVGVSWAPFDCQHSVITVEGRFGDEAAFYLNGQLFF